MSKAADQQVTQTLQQTTALNSNLNMLIPVVQQQSQQAAAETTAILQSGKTNLYTSIGGVLAAILVVFFVRKK